MDGSGDSGTPQSWRVVHCPTPRSPVPWQGSWAATSEADKEILGEGTGGTLQDTPVGRSALRSRGCALGLLPVFLL